MMDRGTIIVDVSGEEKRSMTVDGILAKFKEAAAGALSDRTVLGAG
jgi:ABC-type uncharacterized transport system ATPase component